MSPMLSKLQRGSEVETLAPLLWHSFATIATLLQVGVLSGLIDWIWPRLSGYSLLILSPVIKILDCFSIGIHNLWSVSVSKERGAKNCPVKGPFSWLL